MRKKGRAVSFLLCLAMFAGSIGAVAEEVNPEFHLSEAVVLMTGSSKALVKGERVDIDVENETVTPVIQNDRTLIPVSFTAEAFGAVSYWDASSRQITFSYQDKLAKMKEGDTAIKINGNFVETDVPVMIMEGRTMLPIRMVAENILGKDVFWDPSGLIVIGDNLPEKMDV